MRNWLEYREQYSVNGDKIYMERVDIDAPIHLFPFYELMEPPQETWVVFGPAIRAFLYEDWALGGHYWIYPFIKSGEIWIDSGVDKTDRPYVWMRLVICRWLMRTYNLNYLEADAIGRAYSTDQRVEDIRLGKVTLHGWYPKKANLILTYSAPTPEKLAKDQERSSWESKEMQAVILSLQSKKDRLKEPQWEAIFQKLNDVAADLNKAANL